MYWIWEKIMKEKLKRLSEKNSEYNESYPFETSQTLGTGIDKKHVFD